MTQLTWKTHVLMVCHNSALDLVYTGILCIAVHLIRAYTLFDQPSNQRCYKIHRKEKNAMLKPHVQMHLKWNSLETKLFIETLINFNEIN